MLYGTLINISRLPLPVSGPASLLDHWGVYQCTGWMDLQHDWLIIDCSGEGEALYIQTYDTAQVTSHEVNMKVFYLCNLVDFRIKQDIQWGKKSREGFDFVIVRSGRYISEWSQMDRKWIRDVKQKRNKKKNQGFKIYIGPIKKSVHILSVWKKGFVFLLKTVYY